MKILKIIFCSLLVCISATSFSQTTQTSNFNSNADGWTIFNQSTGASSAAVYSSTGGNPGGFINDGGTFSGPVIFYGEAPAKFRGNFLAAYNKSLTFDLKTDFVGTNNTNGDVIIANSVSGITLYYQLPTKPATTFTSYSVTLNETFAGWHVGSPAGTTPTQAQMQNVLGNITSLRIRTKYTTANTTTATGSIDNVVLNVATLTITDDPDEITVCVGATGTFTAAATGTTNITYQWQYSSSGGGPFNDIANGGGYSNVTTPTLSVNTTGNFGAGHYRAKVNGDFVTTQFTNNAELHITTVTPPTTTPAAACQNATATLTANGGANGEYKWYTTSTGPSQIAGEVNSTYTTPVQTSTATFTYYVSLNNGTCESVRTPVSLVINTCTAQPTDIIIFNAVSPNGDGKNDIFLIQNIELLPDTKNNTVTIFNRWGDKVFTTDNYNNDNHVFRGLDDDGSVLPNGFYYYKIKFVSDRKEETGFLSLMK